MSLTELSRVNVYSSPDGFWHRERVQRLQELFHQGLSNQQIAVEMGVKSRNAVIGKLHRLGLKREAVQCATSQSRGAVSIVARIKKERPHQPPPALAVVRAPPIADSDLPAIETDGLTDIPVEISAGRVPLLSAHKGQCRWPAAADGSATMVCGDDISPGTSYCARHCAIAFAGYGGRGFAVVA